MQNKKNLLMVAYTNYRTDPRVIRAAEAAAEAGFAVDVLVLNRDNEPREEQIRGVNVIHVNQSRYRGGGVVSYVTAYLQFFLRCFFIAAKRRWRKKYAIVHVHNMPDFIIFSGLIPKLFGAKLILDIHDPMPNTFSSKYGKGDKGLIYSLLLWQEKLSAAFADRVLTVHDPVKDHILVKQHGMRPDAVDVVANFPDDKIFYPRQAEAANEGLRLCFHGTILKRLGLYNVVEAIARARHKNNIHVRIIGEGDFSEELKRLIASHNLETIIEFDNRMYPIEQIPAQLAGYNLGLVPLELSSITEFVLPLKLLEYIGLGMAVVTVHNTAIDYYLTSDDCLFYDPADPQSLSDVIDRLAENPQLLAQYKQRALDVRERFLWSNEKQRYISMLRELSRASPVEAAVAGRESRQ